MPEQELTSPNSPKQGVILPAKPSGSGQDTSSREEEVVGRQAEAMGMGRLQARAAGRRGRDSMGLTRTGCSVFAGNWDTRRCAQEWEKLTSWGLLLSN